MIRFSSFNFPCISATPTMSLSSYFEIHRLIQEFLSVKSGEGLVCIISFVFRCSLLHFLVSLGEGKATLIEQGAETIRDAYHGYGEYEHTRNGNDRFEFESDNIVNGFAQKKEQNNSFRPEQHQRSTMEEKCPP